MRVIGPPLSDSERLALIAFARSQIGVRFKHLGRVPGKRLDCLGKIVCGLQSIGRPVKDKAAYGREPHKDGLHEGLIENLGLPVADYRPGDVLEMRFQGDPCHVGLVGDYLYGGLSLIHTSSEFGEVIEHVLDDLWRSRIAWAYAL